MMNRKKLRDITFKLFGVFKNKLVFYAQNSTVGGLNYLFEEHAPFWGRLFWLTLLIASGYFAYYLIKPVLELDDNINFTVDTRYLNWSTKFASITVCEDLYTKETQRKLEASSLFKEHLADLKLSYGHKKYLTEILYGRGACTNDFCTPCGHTIPCDVPWREIIDQIHAKCEGLLAKCEYNGVPFSCCDYFHQIDSEFGSCFAFNSLQSKNVTPADLFYVNSTTGPGSLSFYVPPKTMISFTGSEELSTSFVNNKFKRRIVDRNTEIYYQITEMENDPLMPEEHIEERGCRFYSEIPDETFHKYKSYGYRACQLAEETEHVYEHCGCISPVRDLDYKEYFCKNYTGLNCLAALQEKKNRGEDVHAGPKKADCLPSCVENEITLIYLSTRLKAPPDAPGLWVLIKMEQLPTLRFRRNVIRTDLDIVVSIGGIIGLLFCASILSFVELIYLFLRK